MPFTVHKERLDRLYTALTRRELAPPDPVQFLYRYPSAADREIVALVASCLAYGRVAHISNSVSTVLDRMGDPAACVASASRSQLRRTLHSFRHRFTSGEELADVLYGAKLAIEAHGSLNMCFVAGLRDDSDTVADAQDAFVRELLSGAGLARSYLLPSPHAGSACKRLNLFLRWLVRQDAVDPGGWRGVPASKLIVPLDTHMHRIGLAFGATHRKQADQRAALELTAAFRRIAPDDPVHYDFALTRLGIRPDADAAAFMAECGLP